MATKERSGEAKVERACQVVPPSVVAEKTQVHPCGGHGVSWLGECPGSQSRPITYPRWSSTNDTASTPPLGTRRVCQLAPPSKERRRSGQGECHGREEPRAGRFIRHLDPYCDRPVPLEHLVGGAPSAPALLTAKLPGISLLTACSIIPAEEAGIDLEAAVACS